MDSFALISMAEAYESPEDKEITLSMKQLAAPAAIAISASMVLGLAEVKPAEAGHYHCGGGRVVCKTKTHWRPKTVWVRHTVKTCYRKPKIKRVRRSCCYSSCYRPCRPMRCCG